MKNLIALSVAVITLVGGSFAAHAGSQDGFGVPSAEQIENSDVNNPKDRFGHETGA